MPISPSPTRVRIAISSPDILAQIRQVFASKKLAVDIVRMPYIEVAVRPAAGAASTDRSAVGNLLHQPVGPASPADAPASRRLCAEYRLNVIEVGDWPKAEQRVPSGRQHPAPAPDPDTDNGTDNPVAMLSQRQHEVMALMSGGVRNSEIAARLRISEKTVKNHINRIFRSLGAGSRVEAVLIWQRHQQNGTTRRSAQNPPLAVAGGRHPQHAGNP
jgi:DNA-binding CsgD family transcriptional regulator